MPRGRKRKKKRQQKKAGKKKVRRGGESASSGAMADALKKAFDDAGERLPGRKKRRQARREPVPSRPTPVARNDSASGSNRTSPVKTGSATQFTSSPGGDQVELIVGLDFGTSCTKVVIQDTARRAGYAVPFDAVKGLETPYLLPTIIWLDQHGEFNLAGRGRSFRNLKQNMMSIAATDPDERAAHKKTLLPHTTAYLALVFRATRSWFLTAHEEDYKGRQIRWRVNTGLPASRFDEPAMPVLYRSTVRRAWYLSTMAAPVSTALADRVQRSVELESENPDALLGPDSIGAFPEVVAAVQGYARSPERREGLHLLVDVGASTMDVTCFRLMEYDDEDQYPIFYATVLKLGGFELFRYRADFVVDTINAAIEYMADKMDGVSEPQNPLKIAFSLDDEDRTELDSKFSNRIGEAIWSVISETKRKREPTAPEWSTKLPTFLCGGAAQIDMYGKALKRIDRNENWSGHLELRDLTLPRVVEAPDLPLGQRQRLLVAFGLSFNPLDIGKLIPQSGIPDPEDEGDRPQHMGQFIGPEMV